MFFCCCVRRLKQPVKIPDLKTFEPPPSTTAVLEESLVYKPISVTAVLDESLFSTLKSNEEVKSDDEEKLEEEEESEDEDFKDMPELEKCD